LNMDHCAICLDIIDVKDFTIKLAFNRKILKCEHMFHETLNTRNAHTLLYDCLPLYK
jgi:hypothetical protein